MKTLAFILLWLWLGVTPVIAQHTVLEKRISLSLNAITMEEAIEQIAQTAEVHVSYSSDLFAVCTSVTLKAENQSLLTLLNTLFAPYEIAYTVHAGQLILFPKKTMVIKEYSIKGSICNEATEEPVAYAVLQIKGKSKGVVADHKGCFELILTEMELGDSLTASCIGYERRSFIGKTLASTPEITIMLKEKVMNLNTVVVTASRLRKKSKNRGNRNWITAGSVYLDTHGQQIALYIDNEKRMNGYIQQASFHLSDKGNVEAPFRVRVLDVDPEKQSPGKDLIPEILVVQPPQDTNGWYDVDLSEYRIRVPPDGFFVAMQGVFPNDYSFYAGDSDFFEIGKHHPGSTNDFMPKSVHYGQRISYSDKKGRNTWHYSLSHQWFQLERHNYNVKISALCVFSYE